MAATSLSTGFVKRFALFTVVILALAAHPRPARCALSPAEAGESFIWREISKEIEPAARYLPQDLAPAARPDFSDDFNDATEAFAKGDFNLALFGFTNSSVSLKADESNESLFWMGEARRRLGKAETAIVAFGKVEGEYRTEARFRRAALADALGRGEEARRYYGEIAQDKTSAHRDEALAWTGRDLFLAGSKEEALNAVELAAAMGGDAKADAVYLGGLILADSARPEEAEKALTGAIMDYPAHKLTKIAQAALGWLFLGERNFDAARRRFDWALEGQVPPSLEHYIRYGLVRVNSAEGKPDEALSQIEALVNAGVDDRYLAASWNWLGRAYKDAGDYKRSLWAFEKALETCADCGGADEANYFSGENSIRLGNHSAAADFFLKVGRESSLAPSALILAAEEDIKAENSGRAISTLKEAQARYRSYEGIHRAGFLLGEALKSAGDGAGAWKAFESVPATSPSYPSALWELALMAREEENYDRSSRLFAKFVANYPNDSRREKAAALLAEADLNRGDLKAASAVYSELERTAEDPAIREEALYRHSLILFSEGKKEEGQKLLAALLKTPSPRENGLPAAITLAKSYASEGRNEEALAYFKRAMELNPTDAKKEEITEGIANANFASGRFGEALLSFRSLGRTPSGFYGEASSLIKMGQLDLAMAAVDEFCGLYPGSDNAQRLNWSLADALAGAGRKEEAARYYKLVVQNIQGEKRLRAILASARNLEAAGNREESLSAYALLADGKDPVSLDGREEYAKLLASLGSCDRAEELFSKLSADLADDRRGALALKEAGRCAAEQKGFERAAGHAGKALERAVLAEPSLRQAILCDLGEYLLKAEANAEAVAPLKDAFEMLGGDSGLRAGSLLGEAYARIGRDEEALKVFKKIGYLYPLDNETSARARLRAADLLLKKGRREEAEAVYREAQSSPIESIKSEAASRLEALLPPQPPVEAK